ncbi:MAG: hypothetical protein QOE89_2374, partial [Pseudonocardiales bacterium]|nr:hypothetical protein [Pseudonocardiales bacterium]
MTALPDASERAGAAHTLTDWLRRSSDVDLMALLRRRPDLALPAPVDLATLASRASVRSSIARALDALDAFSLRVLEVVAGLGAGVSTTTVHSWFAPGDVTAVDAAVRRLRDWLLLWGDNHNLHPVGAVREVIGPYPAGLGRSADELFA